MSEALAVTPTSADPVNTDAPSTSSAPNGQPQDNGQAVKDAAAEAMRKYKVKVDGEELEVDEKELLKGYSHTRAANKILQEGKRAQKQAEEFVKMMKDDNTFWEVAQKMGKNPRTLAESFLASQLEEEMLDPKEKELREKSRRLQEYEEREKREAEARAKEVEAARVKELVDQYNKEFVEVLEKSKLPKTKESISKMASYIHRTAKIGYKISVEEAAKLVEDDYRKVIQSIASDAEGETLIKLLGEDTANKIRKWDTSRVKTPEQMLRTPEEQSNEVRKRDKQKPMSIKEWREFNRRK